MKILKFKGKMSLKNKLLIVLAIVTVLLITTTVLAYIFCEPARDFINIYILRKEVTEEDIATIKLDVDKSESIYAYGRYISVLSNSKLSIYNSYASKEAELDVPVSNPIYAKNSNYLVVAEKNGQRIYLIQDDRILWENKIEGSVAKVNVGRSGDVSVITTGTSYKSVIITFDKSGVELFKTYLASTIAVDTDISIDRKYLGVAEINTSGTLIESSIKIIDIEKAVKGDTTNSVIYRYASDSNRIITDIKYQERGQLVCIYDDSVHMIYEDKDNVLVEFNSNTKIADINLKSYVVRAEETKAGLFSSKTDIILKNIITGADTSYEVDSSIKEIVAYNNISAVNIGTEIHFINLNGWLEKKYKSNQEVKEIVLGSSICGIVYRDRVKILTF